MRKYGKNVASHTESALLQAAARSLNVIHSTGRLRMRVEVELSLLIDLELLQTLL